MQKDKLNLGMIIVLVILSIMNILLLDPNFPMLIDIIDCDFWFAEPTGWQMYTLGLILTIVKILLFTFIGVYFYIKFKVKGIREGVIELIGFVTSIAVSLFLFFSLIVLLIKSSEMLALDYSYTLYSVWYTIFGWYDVKGLLVVVPPQLFEIMQYIPFVIISFVYFKNSNEKPMQIVALASGVIYLISLIKFLIIIVLFDYYVLNIDGTDYSLLVKNYHSILFSSPFLILSCISMFPLVILFIIEYRNNIPIIKVIPDFEVEENVSINRNLNLDYEKSEISPSISMFLFSRISDFPNDKIAIIKNQLGTLDESKMQYLFNSKFHNPQKMFVISLFGGCLGIDRFLLGQSGLGVIKLITAGGCGIWWLVDLILIQEETKKLNFVKFTQLLLLLK